MIMKRILAIGIGVLIAGAAYAQTVILQPSGAASIAIVAVRTPALTQSLVIKASSGNLYSVTATSPLSAGFLMLLNATSLPADGTVVPTDCVPVSAGGSATISFIPGPPQYFTTGILAVMSSTGCFTKTNLTSAFIKALVQ